MRIAYLCNRYPAISLTFVMREIKALRRLGMQIDTFSVRQALADNLLSEADRDEYASTYAIVPPKPVPLLAAHASAFARHPGRYLETLRLALRLRPPGLRGGLWQCFYFAEAIQLWSQCRKRGITHIHAQFANVATDVALLVTHFASTESQQWSWSFALHGPVEFYDISQSRLAEKLKRAKFVICISDFARSQAMAFLDHREWHKLHVVHCGVDTDEFDPATRLADPSEPGPQAGMRVLNVGRLVGLKGHAALLRAFALLHERVPDALLTIVGDGALRADLEALARELELDQTVRFAGPVGQDEILDYYRAADVFCMSSFAEGLPVVLMEAMAMGMPVVTTRIAGIPELVEDDSGVVVPAARPDLLADALEQLAHDRSKRQAMGIAGRAKVRSEFDIRDCAARLKKIFERELSEGASHDRAAGVLVSRVASPPSSESAEPVAL